LALLVGLSFVGCAGMRIKYQPSTAAATAPKLFGAALTDLANKASAEFKSPAFLAAMGK
jgi:hypothetical protein